jgi:hypothetical protein
MREEPNVEYCTQTLLIANVVLLTSQTFRIRS